MLSLGIALALAPGGKLSLPVAGSGVIFLASTVFLIAGGALGELVYKLGDVRDVQFSRLTQRVWRNVPASSPSLHHETDR
jgi:hypothetical protein